MTSSMTIESFRTTGCRQLATVQFFYIPYINQHYFVLLIISRAKLTSVATTLL